MGCWQSEDKKWLDILREGPTGFADRQNEGCKKNSTFTHTRCYVKSFCANHSDFAMIV